MLHELQQFRTDWEQNHELICVGSRFPRYISLNFGKFSFAGQCALVFEVLIVQPLALRVVCFSFRGSHRSAFSFAGSALYFQFLQVPPLFLFFTKNYGKILGKRQKFTTSRILNKNKMKHIKNKKKQLLDLHAYIPSFLFSFVCTILELDQKYKFAVQIYDHQLFQPHNFFLLQTTRNESLFTSF